MKQSSVIISVIVAAAVLLAAFATGLYIKEVRRKYKAAESEAATEPETKQAEITPTPPQESRPEPHSISPEQRAQLTEQINDIKQRWASMSEAEREEFRAKIDEIIQAKRTEDRTRFQTTPPEGRNRFGEEFLEIKNRWENMSEQEKQEYRDKMRETANAIRQGND
jgi:hypothetical protein